MTCAKIRYHSGSQARRALDAIRRSPRQEKKPLRAYPCPNCGGWHLTSEPQGRDDEREGRRREW